MKRLIRALLVCCLAHTSATSAQDRVTSFLDRPPTVSSLSRALLPSAPPKADTRGIGVTRNTKKETPRAALAIRFELDSAELTDEATGVLDVVAESIHTTNLKFYTFRIEGHTDASGEDDYNLDLSRARARSVKEYLVAVRGVEAEILQTEGFGEQHLFDTLDPLSAANRRVEIVNIGP